MANDTVKAPHEGYTVVDTVDVLDRPCPNADPAGKNNWSYGESDPQPKIGNEESDKGYDEDE